MLIRNANEHMDFVTTRESNMQLLMYILDTYIYYCYIYHSQREPPCILYYTYVVAFMQLSDSRPAFIVMITCRLAGFYLLGEVRGEASPPNSLAPSNGLTVIHSYCMQELPS